MDLFWRRQFTIGRRTNALDALAGTAVMIDLMSPTQYAAHLALSRHDAGACWHTEHLVECVMAARADPDDMWSRIALDGALQRAAAFLEEVA